jgi:uncharacterized protein YqhQ
LRKEEEQIVYQQAMETYRHFHAFIASVFLVIAMIVGVGVFFRWIKEFPGLWLLIIIPIGAFILILLLLIVLVMSYTEKSRMEALEVACKIEESWFLPEEERLACNLREVENKRNPVWKIVSWIWD